MSEDAVPLRPAATVMLVRDGRWRRDRSADGAPRRASGVRRRSVRVPRRSGRRRRRRTRDRRLRLGTRRRRRLGEARSSKRRAGVLGGGDPRVLRGGWTALRSFDRCPHCAGDGRRPAGGASRRPVDDRAVPPPWCGARCRGPALCLPLGHAGGRVGAPLRHPLLPRRRPRRPGWQPRRRRTRRQSLGRPGRRPGGGASGASWC